MSLRIEHPDPEAYEVEDYDFQFANGLLYSISVAKTLGDTIDLQQAPLATIFHLAEKPSPADPEAKVPSEDITVLMNHVIMVARRTRTVTPPTFKEKDLFRQHLLQKMPQSIH